MEYYEGIKSRPLRTLYRGLITVQRGICYICAIALPLIITYQVVLRYVLKAPLMGIEELMTFFIIWLYMMGGSVASEQRAHIECGILTLYMKKEKTIAVFQCCKNIFSMIVCIWLARWAYWYFDYSLNLWKTSDILKIPMFLGESAMFIGLVFMLFFGMLELMDACKNAVKVFGKNKTGEVDKE
ncbi:MAG: TRAP transporter small permease [Oscillospiraceae bacterium]|nr:TRAP transporter small permease [Oscillospiraceae bacterium]